MLPEYQMTPALLDSDEANILFANQELAFAQRNGDLGAASGPLSVSQAQEHLETARLVLKVDQDRVQTQQDIMNLRAYTVPKFLRASQ